MTKAEMEKMAIEHACLRYLCNGRPELDLGKAFEAGAKAGIELERKRSEGLVEALKLIELTPPHTDTEIRMQYCAWKALKEYEDLNGK